MCSTFRPETHQRPEFLAGVISLVLNQKEENKNMHKVAKQAQAWQNNGRDDKSRNQFSLLACLISGVKNWECMQLR
jgi:hypothetical protein